MLNGRKRDDMTMILDGRFIFSREKACCKRYCHEVGCDHPFCCDIVHTYPDAGAARAAALEMGGVVDTDGVDLVEH